MYLIRIGGKRQSDESQLSYRPIKAFRSSVLFFLPKIEEGPRLVRVSGVVVGGEGSRQGAGEPGAPRWQTQIQVASCRQHFSPGRHPVASGQAEMKDIVVEEVILSMIGDVKKLETTGCPKKHTL